METDRLILRKWSEDDADALYKYASDPKVSELALWDCHTSVDMSREVISRFFLPNPHLFAIVHKDTNEPIGCIGLVPEEDSHHPLLPNEKEVGYWIGRPHWNNGLTTEALDIFISYCRDNLHLDSLLITTDEKNKASQRVAQKNGFIFLEDYIYDGIPSKAFRLQLNR